jgi:uncharacterized membrane protein YraQ (UPF0718 family)
MKSSVRCSPHWGLDIASRWGGSAQFFLYDVLKITILLCLLIFIISYIQSYFPPERSKKFSAAFTASAPIPSRRCWVR